MTFFCGGCGFRLHPAPAEGAPADPSSPGAGIAPPAQLPPPPQPAAAPPPQYPPQAYAPPYTPADGNTSGMGEGYPVPVQASGWTWAGFVPFGLSGFVNGSAVWGVIGMVAWLLQSYWVYAIIFGFMGRTAAWKNRRFESLLQYEETMRVWNTWGILFFVLSLIGVVLYALYFFGMMWFAMSQAFDPSI
ncbi:hypothetical protein IIA79_06770 [bacterium]|nr:hypothetical protein [bacterium]